MSDDVEPIPADVLYIEAHHHDTGATIVLVGEFDMTGTELFWAHVSGALEAHPTSITIDAGGLSFIDSSGLMALLRARDAAVDAGVAFEVRQPSPALRRIAEVAGVKDLLRGA